MQGPQKKHDQSGENDGCQNDRSGFTIEKYSHQSFRIKIRLQDYLKKGQIYAWAYMTMT